ncbi:MAG TPA: copper-binding protein [Nitrospiraceae bacterium]|nr:copper-binding protein [Nitrospiraceae bacterium]
MITRPQARAFYPDDRCIKTDENGVSGRWARTLCLSVMLVAGDAAMGASLLGGTVLSIDREARQLTLQMPEGHPSRFPAASEALLRDVKVGDRVSIELDRDGKITKLIKLPIDQGN